MKYIITLFLLAFSMPAFAGNAYDHLEKTNTLRCGFQYWDGGVAKNDKTAEMEGFIVDLTNELAKIGGFEVEWVGPIDWGQVKAELASNKIDAMCAGMWQAGQKARYMIFSDPFAYQGVEAYVRPDETRFTADFKNINDPSITIVVVDGDNDQFIANAQFPKAKQFSMPLGASETDKLQALIHKKSDVAFISPGQGYQFMQANPNSVQPLSPNNFLRVFGNTYVVNSEEFQLMHYLETLLAEIENSGYVDRLIDTYNKDYPHMFIKKTKPYVESK
jgi:ABC-type amino acid transport substrate-binding protein